MTDPHATSEQPGIRLGLLSVATQDVSRLGSFYRHLLARDPDVVIVGMYEEFRLPGLTLGIYRCYKPEFAPCLGSLSLCVQVEDLQAVLGLEVLAGIPVSPVRTEVYGQEVEFRDPDGNRVVLHQPVSGWPDAFADT